MQESDLTCVFGMYYFELCEFVNFELFSYINGVTKYKRAMQVSNDHLNQTVQIKRSYKCFGQYILFMLKCWGTHFNGQDVCKCKYRFYFQYTPYWALYF